MRFPEREGRTEYRVAFKVRSTGLMERQERVQSRQWVEPDAAETYLKPDELNLSAKSLETAAGRAWVLLVTPPSSAVALPKQFSQKKCFFLYLRVIPNGALNGFNTGINTSGL